MIAVSHAARARKLRHNIQKISTNQSSAERKQRFSSHILSTSRQYR